MIQAPDEFSVYMNKAFARFARKARITDKELWNAAHRANSGQINADLGGGVIKQRLSRIGEGKSGSSRSIILFRRNKRAVFVYGFEKKDLANIRPDELAAFRELAEIVLSYTEAQMKRFTEDGIFLKIQSSEVDANG